MTVRVRAIVSLVAALMTVAPPFRSAAQPAPAPPTIAISPAESTLDIWMLDIGQGSCMYVECPDRRSAILVDCGSSTASLRTPSAKTVNWVNKKIAQVDALTVIISHGDKDHYSLLPSLNEARVDRVRMGGVRADFSASAIGRWLDEVDEGEGSVELFAPNTFSANDPSYACAPAQLDILTASAFQAFPQTPVDSRKNADSAIVRVTYQGVSVIMAGDAEGMTQKAALANARAAGLDLGNLNVVMGSHHGARTAGSNNDAWVKALNPAVAGFSASVDVSFRHPQCEVIGRYDAYAQPLAGPKRPVPCGVGDVRNERFVRGKILSTYVNGHVLYRIGRNGLTVLCQVPTSGCDGTIPPSLLP